ncbi:hypothetical protein AB990_13180 [Alkalihalobacillus pseudalcaliphilus]|nr:hypothetical protein AB990_13180 [Alkalihalobacillus pseudalcaliphilus]
MITGKKRPRRAERDSWFFNWWLFIHFATNKDESRGYFLNSWPVYNSITIRSQPIKQGALSC